MLLNKGDKIHVITRRAFPEDVRRHFAGEVVEATDMLMRAEGYVFVFDSGSGEYVRRASKRTRIFSLVSNGNIVNILPQDIKLEDLQYQFTEAKRLVMSDGGAYQLDINEFGMRL